MFSVYTQLLSSTSTKPGNLYEPLSTLLKGVWRAFYRAPIVRVTQRDARSLDYG